MSDGDELDEMTRAFEANRHDGNVRPMPHRGPIEPFRVIDPRSWTHPAPPRRWLVPDWIPIGTVTALYGDGGVGKSLLAQQLMTSVALALPWLGLDVAAGKVLGLMCEDDEDELHRRQEAINASLGVEMESLENLRLISRVGEDNVLMTWRERGAAGELTPAFHELRRQCALYRPRLIVLDTMADFFGGDEINRVQVRQFVQGTFGALSREFQAAVLALGHPSVSGISTGSGTAGSTAWNNTVRSRLYFSRLEGEDANPDGRKLARMKANYAPKDADISVSWRDGVFAPDDGQPSTELPEWDVIDAMFDDIKAAWDKGKPWSSSPVTKATGRYWPAYAERRFGLSAKVSARLLIDWLASGHLEVEAVDGKSKQKGLRVVRRLER